MNTIAPASSRSEARAPSSALDLTVEALEPLLRTPGLTEVCINRPGEAFIETGNGWRCEPLPFATYEWCLRLAKLTAHATRQRVTEESPLLSASLPTSERIQFVIPPATLPGHVCLSIRKPTAEVWSLEDLAARGIFSRTRCSSAGIDESERELQALLESHQPRAFLRRAVCEKKNIVISGATGAGKTTLAKALIQEIPSDERIITIEDAEELKLPRHHNAVRLFYSKDGQGQSRIAPKQLLECSLRLRPDRILMSELRAEEAFDYLRATAAHPGSITSVHASSAAIAFEQLALLVKQSNAGRELPRTEILNLLYLLVDVVVQFSVVNRARRITEIWYEPARKRGTDSRR